MKICLFVVDKTNKNLTIFIFHKFFKAFLFKCQVISGICFIYLNTIGSLVTKYVPDYLNEIVEQLVLLWELDTSTFVYGSGKRKSKEQRHYEHLTTFCQNFKNTYKKLKSVVLIETVTLKQIIQLPLCVSKRITWAMISFCQHIMYRLV